MSKWTNRVCLGLAGFVLVLLLTSYVGIGLGLKVEWGKQSWLIGSLNTEILLDWDTLDWQGWGSMDRWPSVGLYWPGGPWAYQGRFIRRVARYHSPAGWFIQRSVCFPHWLLLAGLLAFPAVRCVTQRQQQKMPPGFPLTPGERIPKPT